MKKTLHSKLIKMMAFLFMIIPLLSPLSSQAQKEGDVPQRFFVDFKNASLVYIPETEVLQIAAQNNVLFSGSDWEKCQLKPYLYHFRHKNWKDFYWKVNTGQKKVYRITKGTFCQLGGRVQRLKITVDVVGGGSAKIPPTRFVLHFSNASLVYTPASKNLNLAAEGDVLTYGKEWKKCNVNHATYHFKQNSWENIYWSVNTDNSIAHRIRNADAFCSPDTFPSEPLNVGIRIVK